MPKTYKVELSEKEYFLVLALRNRFRYREVTIMMRDGTPQFIVRAWDSDALEQPILDRKKEIGIK